MDKQEYINKKAKELFSEIGYKGTTMDLLASKCDMGKGTLYLYYTSKEDVLKSIIDQLLANIESSVIKVQLMNVSFSEQVMEIIHEILKLRNEQVLVVKLVYEAKQMNNQVVDKYITQIDNYIVETLTDTIDRAIKKKYIKKCNSKFMAFLIYRIYISLVFEWEQKENTKLTEKELFNLLENLFK